MISPRTRWALALVEYAEALPESARLRRAALVALALALVCALLAVAPVAEAQADHVLLARSCISERGFRVETDDCAGIGLVVRARMERRGETFRDAIRALAPRLHGGTITSRTWLLSIDESCTRPRGLRATWARARGDLPSRRDACLATMAEARAIVDGTRVLDCERMPEHWGSRADTERRRRAGYRWRDAVCPGATFVNRFGFLARPALVDPE